MSLARGIGLFAGTPLEIVAETASAAEELGYASFWANHPGATDGLAALEAAAGSTTTIALGVGVVPLHTRSAASVVDGVRAHGLPTDRLLLGIGTAGPGAFRVAREGTGLIRAELGCRVAMGALGERASRLAGEIADAVLFNWLTPEHARLSATWVEAGAAAAGRPRPRLYAYVRLALGRDARERVVEEGGRYGRGPYAAHFERMGVDPIETAIAVAAPGEVPAQLRRWQGAVDEVVLRLLPASASPEAHLELVRAGGGS
jgi:alkanesulfonate monooxygenase SsuD/methylene tetrahydromethanopterin reductase-like flavin-dependent oxidoreductase (luciferase family)